jgi:hypothetical protein
MTIELRHLHCNIFLQYFMAIAEELMWIKR